MKKACVTLAAALLFALLVISTAFAADPFTVVLGGLQSPRGLTFGPAGGCTWLKLVMEAPAAKSPKSAGLGPNTSRRETSLPD
jgi:hypothetical protein